MQRFKKILSTTITVTTISWSIGIGTLIPLLPVNANVTTLTPTALISSPLSLNSSSTAAQGVALGINVIKSNGGTETVSSVGVLLNPSGNFTLSDLASLDTTTNSGLALYVDDKTSGSSYGTFNATDDDVITGATPSPMQVNRFAKLTPTATTVVGQGDSLALTAGDIVFAATTASPDNSMGGGSYAWLLVTGLNETGTVVGTASTSLRLNGNNANPSYAGSSRFSVFTPQKTGVFNLNSGGGGTTTFSDASEPAVGDIVIYGRSNQSMGSPQWGIVTNSFTGSASPVNGSNISSQGNGNYRISKIAGTTGVYTVANGSFTASSGTYTSPQIGDLVLYQSGFNTANWGIITNATLVGGTFAINGQVVTNGTYSISKPTGYGATSVTTTDTSLAITAGDATFAYATNNPIPTFSMMGGSSFGPGATWYSVTTGGTGVTSSALRINDASGAPSFGWYVSLTANNTPSSNIAIPQDNAVNNSGDEFFVVVRSSANPGSGSSFSVGIHSNLFQIQNGGPPQAMISAVTAAISLTPADSSAPTATSGGPPDAQTGVSVEATVDQSYSEALNQASTECANAGACASFTNVTLKVCTGADQSSANLACGASNTSVGPQLCTSVTRSNGNVKITCNHDALATGKWFVSHYELIADASGNAQGQGAAITRRFKTGTTGTANTTPPFVQNSQPGQGSQNHPLNAPITLSFNVAMATTGGGAITNDANIGLFVESAGNVGTPVTTTKAYIADTKTVTVTPTTTLAANTAYIVRINTTATSATTPGIALTQPYSLSFRTSGNTDNVPPTVRAVNPTSGTSEVSRAVTITAGFSEDMDQATIISPRIKLAPTNDLNNTVAGTVTYSASSQSVSFTPSAALTANTSYTFTIVSGVNGVKDLAGMYLSQNFTSTITTTNTADSTKPYISYATANNFSVTITFSKNMKSDGGGNAANTIGNYTLETPVGLTPTSLYPLTGKTVTWDAATRAATITGLGLTLGSSFRITVATTTQDLSNNAMDDTGTPAKNIAQGSVQNSNTNTTTVDQSQQGTNPSRVYPLNRSAGAVSNYKIEFPVSTSIPSEGQIILSFPQGFTVTNAAAITTTSSSCNTDINGPGANTVTIASVVGDTNAGTVTITTAGAATGANVQICMDISGITNSTVPSSAGYTTTIQTKDTADNYRALLQTIPTSAFFLSSAGSSTLTVNVFRENSNGINDPGEGVNAVTVYLKSPAGGEQKATTGVSGNLNGVATISNLTDGNYEIRLDPNGINFPGNFAPQNISISGNTTKNFAFSAATAITISGTVTGPNGARVDVFASSQNGFSKTTITLAGNTPVAYSLPVQASTKYNLGVGPEMIEGSTKPPEASGYMPPPNVEVAVALVSVPNKNFTLTTTSKTITGFVRDANGTGVNDAGVFARPIAASTGNDSTTGFGTGTRSAADGSFTLNVVPGIYLVGVAKPGMPNTPDQQIDVPTTGNNAPTSLIFKLNVGTSLTITGTIKDDNGNAIPYAGLAARKVNSTSDTTVVGGGTQNFIGGQSDANGAYTLYIDAGTWIIEAFAPGFGRLGSKTVTVATESLSGQDFSAQTLSLGTITGTATKANITQQGVMVRAEGAAGGNMSQTDSSGNYTLKVPVGTYTVRCMFPGIGESTPLAVTVTPNITTSNNNCVLAAPITITVNLTDGTSPITNAFVDVRDSNGRGFGANTSTTSGIYAVYSITVPPGTYTVRSGHPSFGPIGTTTGVNATQSIIYTANAGALYAVTGTVQANSAALSGAWVSIRGTPTGQSFPIQIGVQTQSNGTFSVSVPAGNYRVRADKPGYQSPAEAALIVSGTMSAGTITLTTAASTITGTVTLNSVGVSGAFVDATDGVGGFAVAQTDPTGAYSLAVGNGTWTLGAHSMGYEGTRASVTVASNSPSNQTITLSAISGFTIKPEKQETMTPSAGGLLTNSDIGDNFKLNIPANALGTGSAAGTVKTQINTAVPTPPTGSVLGKNAITISAVDSTGQPIKTLNDSVTVVLPYTEGDLPAGSSESNLVLGVWNDATQSYDSLSTTVDTAANTLTATADHFSVFAPLLFAGVTAAATSSAETNPPATPTNVKATSDGKTVTLTWTDPSDSDLSRIVLLRNTGGSTPISGNPYAYIDKGKQTYTDTTVTADMTYKYIVRAQDALGNVDSNINQVLVKVEAGAATNAVVKATPKPSTTKAPVKKPAPKVQKPAIKKPAIKKVIIKKAIIKKVAPKAVLKKPAVKTKASAVKKPAVKKVIIKKAAIKKAAPKAVIKKPTVKTKK